MGGQLSWLLAALHPQQVQSLTVLSRPHPQAFVAAFAKDQAQAERSKHHRAFQQADAAQKLLQDDAKSLRAMFSHQGVGALDQQAYLSILGQFDALNAAINWYRAPVQAGAEQPLGGSEIPAVTVPTLYIWGDADATVGSVAAHGTADFVAADYRFEVLPEIGHFITDQFRGKLLGALWSVGQTHIPLLRKLFLNIVVIGLWFLLSWHNRYPLSM